MKFNEFKRDFLTWQYHCLQKGVMYPFLPGVFFLCSTFPYFLTLLRKHLNISISQTFHKPIKFKQTFYCCCFYRNSCGLAALDQVTTWSCLEVMESIRPECTPWPTCVTPSEDWVSLCDTVIIIITIVLVFTVNLLHKTHHKRKRILVKFLKCYEYEMFFMFSRVNRVCSVSVGLLAQMKIGCDNSVVRLVSSGNYINQVSFQYRLLDHHELPKSQENSLDNFCTVEWDLTQIHTYGYAEISHSFLLLCNCTMWNKDVQSDDIINVFFLWFLTIFYSSIYLNNCFIHCRNLLFFSDVDVGVCVCSPSLCFIKSLGESSHHVSVGSLLCCFMFQLC